MDNSTKFAAGVAVSFALAVTAAWLVPKRAGEPTDSPAKKSGLQVVYDHGTGCQYLKHYNSQQIIPRMGADGKQVCTVQKD